MCCLLGTADECWLLGTASVLLAAGHCSPQKKKFRVTVMAYSILKLFLNITGPYMWSSGKQNLLWSQSSWVQFLLLHSFFQEDSKTESVAIKIF